MPETAEAHKPNFRQSLAEAMKPIEAELSAKAGEGAAAPKPEDTKAAPAAAVPKAEPAAKDPDEEIITGKRSPKSEDFKRVKTLAGEFKTKAEQAEAKYAEATKRLEQAEKAPKHNAELIGKLEAERDRYRGMFEQVAVELSPEFHEGYSKQLASVKAALPADKADQLMALFHLPDSDAKRERLLEIMDEADAFTMSKVARADERVQEILADKQAKLTAANQTLGKISEERQAKLKKQQEELGQVIESSLTEAEKEIPFLKKKDGDEKWNKSVEERSQIARAIFSDQFESPAEKAQASIYAAIAPSLIADNKALVAALAERDATIQKMQGASPGMEGGQGGGEGGGVEKLSFSQRVGRTLNQR